jgi:hypothetical protein
MGITTSDFPLGSHFVAWLQKLTAVKRAILGYRENPQHPYAVDLCQCEKIYDNRSGSIHQPECIVGICIKGWDSMQTLLDRVSYVKYDDFQNFRAKARIWTKYDPIEFKPEFNFDPKAEYLLVQGLKDCAHKYVFEFCMRAPTIYDRHMDVMDYPMEFYDDIGVELLFMDRYEYDCEYTSPSLPLDFFKSMFHAFMSHHRWMCSQPTE